MQIKEMPIPLYRKMIITALTGSGCMLFAIAYYFAVGDHVLLIISAILLLNCAWKVYSIYRLAKNKSYEMVEGTCVRINPQLVGRFRTVTMMDDDGIETTLRLAKNCKLIIGEKYRLYFDNRNQLRTGSGFIDKRLATGNYLGHEVIVDKVATEEHGN